MKKLQYIQPKVGTMVLPQSVLMQDINPASGGSFPTDFPVNPGSPSPIPPRGPKEG